MHPIDLMRKYSWSYQKLATEFGVSEVEARRWGFRKTASNYRNPPSMAYKLAEKIDKELSTIYSDASVRTHLDSAMLV